ncbi:MAG TPA: hypothetical protein VK326_08645 [Solirubrobacterales bacterium]|nr:hypothetical protein [Solirubrobacterales bacterium]
MRVRVQSDRVSTAGRAAHDIGLAAMVGGNLYGRFAMHPALREIDDPRERGAVLNRAWRRYGTISTLSLGAVVAGWLGARAGETRARYLTGRERTLARAKDAAVGAVALTGLAAAVEGVRFGGLEPDGAVPVVDGNEAAPEASEPERRLKRRLNLIGGAHLISALALAVINTAIAQVSYRRPPLRRLAFRRY